MRKKNTHKKKQFCCDEEGETEKEIACGKKRKDESARRRTCYEKSRTIGFRDTKDRGGSEAGGGTSLIKWGANATPANI